MFTKIAAAIVLATGMVGVPLAIHQLGVNRAFAEVQKAASNVRSVTYELTLSAGDSNAFVSYETQKIMYLGNDLGRMESSTGEVVVIDRQKNIITQLIPAQKKVLILQGAAVGSTIPSLIEQLCNLPNRAVKNLPEREMDGKKVVGFAVDENGTRLTIWVDATTRLPVRIEGLRQTEDRMLRQVSEKFVFNQDLDESLFAITAPDGYVTERSSLGSVVEVADQARAKERARMEEQRRKAEEALK